MNIEDKYNIQLRDWDHDLKATVQWVLSVRAALQRIERSEVGGLLLRSIKYHGKWVDVSPFRLIGEAPDSPALCNALARPKRGTGNRPIWAKVKISPQRFAKGSFCAERNKAAGGVVQDADEVLFHELVHAFRSVSEKLQGGHRLSGGLLGYDYQEEFIAVLVSNIYASSNGKVRLRADHRGHDVLPDALNGSFRFFQVGSASFALVDALCKANPGFCRAVSKIRTPFNPIRAYFTDPARARRMSEGAKAAARDVNGVALDVVDALPWVRVRNVERLMKL